MITTVYLVRHGETDLNAANRCQGSLDVALNANGELQARNLAQRLAGVGFDAAYSSPLSRALATAQAVLRESDVSVVVDDALAELSYGDWQGLSHDEWPDGAASTWNETPWQALFPGGEDLANVHTRVVPALERIVQAHPSETVLVAAHGHINRVLLLHLTGQPRSSFWDIEQVNCESWRLEFEWTSNMSGREVPQFRSATKITDGITSDRAWSTINAKTKPLGALGQLEEYAVQLAVLQQSLTPDVGHSIVCVFAGDHGVTEEGVSAYPRAVTAEMMKNFSGGGAAINVIGRANNVRVEVFDVGVDANLEYLREIEHHKVRNGTRNFAKEPAMTTAERDRAMAVGTAAVDRAVRAGAQAIGLGEMGIGNSTAAAALLSALTTMEPSATAGRGTGISDETLLTKERVIATALRLHGPHVLDNDPLEWLRRVGGLEIAAMVGAALRVQESTMAIVADGFISTVAVLAAAHIANQRAGDGASTLGNRLFVAHRSAERGHQIAIDALGAVCGRAFHPMLDLRMRLGEGSGAALAMPVLRAAARIMSEMATFESAGVSTGGHREHQA